VRDNGATGPTRYARPQAGGRHASSPNDATVEYTRLAAHVAGHQRKATPPPDSSPWHLLLVMPILLPLVTPLYNRTLPDFAGIPFFYWFQMGLVAFSTVVIVVVHLLTKERR
jgi:Protein of unknown function (DUF3311)